ncbi:MAG: hypothetical protein LUG99_06875 [Lachnospiraceae bacterium]|nr:hypothetical protein [Lachnospiraceae bacterium]
MRKRIKWTMAAVLLAMMFAFAIWMAASRMSQPQNATLVYAEDAVRVC